jgi:transcriptional regulator with GAF, ATPase, and Fis domain
MTGDREREVTRAFVSLATKLARGDDVLELVTELTVDAAKLLDIASAGLLLADVRGVLHLLAASSERTHELETFQLQRAEGPCLDCYTSATPVTVADLTAETDRWPQFAPGAVQAGFRSVHALPLRFGVTTIGTLGLFGTTVGALNDEDQRLGQALADVASVSIIQDRTASSRETLNAQLQSALDSRIAIEQSKGILAQFGSIDMDAAFELLRSYCRDRNERLSAVAKALSSRDLSPQQVLDHMTAKSRMEQ